MPSAAAPFLADRFASILGGLQRALAASMVRRPAAEHAVMMLLWRYVVRRIGQYRRLAELVGRGKRPKPRTPAPPSVEARPPRPPALRLPSCFAWLCPLVPGVAVYGIHLQALLAEPELQILIEAAPQQMGRIFRPLLRMLGTDPGTVPGFAGVPPAPPSAPRRPAAPKPPAQKPPAAKRPPGPWNPPRSGPSHCVRQGNTIRLGSFTLRVAG